MTDPWLYHNQPIIQCHVRRTKRQGWCWVIRTHDGTTRAWHRKMGYGDRLAAIEGLRQALETESTTARIWYK